MTRVPSHEFVPHTAELAFRISAGSVAEIYEEACVALGALLVEEAGDDGPAAEQVLTLDAADAEALLVDLLNELIYQAETARWAPRSARVESWEAGHLTIRLWAVSLRGVPSRIKSATHHGLRLAVTARGVMAEVILDV